MRSAAGWATMLAQSVMIGKDARSARDRRRIALHPDNRAASHMIGQHRSEVDIRLGDQRRRQRAVFPILVSV
jgi:hypothetical protein